MKRTRLIGLVGGLAVGLAVGLGGGPSGLAADGALGDGDMPPMVGKARDGRPMYMRDGICYVTVGYMKPVFRGYLKRSVCGKNGCASWTEPDVVGEYNRQLVPMHDQSECPR